MKKAAKVLPFVALLIFPNSLSLPERFAAST